MKTVSTILITLLIGSLFYFVPSANILDTFIPRAVCMQHNTKLIALHGISDFIIWLSYFIIASSLFAIYGSVTERFLPFRGFVWMFGTFIMLCGFTHFFEVIDLYITFYWLDGIVKCVTAMVSIVVAVKFLPAARALRNMKTEKEYHELEDKYNKLEERLKTLENTKSLE